MNFKEISDLGLIAALMSKGYQPRERRKDNTKIIFLFDNDEVISDLIDDYYNNRLEVNALEYSTTLRTVKGTIFKMKNER